MEQPVLYDLLSEAKSKNKSVQLFSNNNLEDLEFIIEPEHKVVNKPGNIIRCDDCLIDLNLIVCALIVPNKQERLEEKRKREKELWDLIQTQPKRARDVVYPLKSKGKEYVG